MSRGDRAFYDTLPDYFTVYRGQNDGATVGLSWTLDKGVAEGFARGHRGIWNPSPIVITAEVYKRDVAFACAERHEAEIVVFKTSRARNQTINQIMVRAALGGWPSKRYFAGMFCAVGLRPKYHARKAFFINRLVSHDPRNRRKFGALAWDFRENRGLWPRVQHPRLKALDPAQVHPALSMELPGGGLVIAGAPLDMSASMGFLMSFCRLKPGENDLNVLDRLLQ